jgi:regulator of sigma E protease
VKSLALSILLAHPKNSSSLVQVHSSTSFLGILLLFTLLAGVGVNSLTSVVQEVVPESSAVAAGFQQGDEIESINGEEITDWARGVELIRAGNGAELSFTVLRNGESIELRATPRLTDVGGEQRYVLGIY